MFVLFWPKLYSFCTQNIIPFEGNTFTTSLKHVLFCQAYHDVTKVLPLCNFYLQSSTQTCEQSKLDCVNYCKCGLKWHSLLFGNNRKLVQVFAVVYSVVKYWSFLIKDYLLAKTINQKCLVQWFECTPDTPASRVQLWLDEVFVYVLLNCICCSHNLTEAVF